MLTARRALLTACAAVLAAALACRTTAPPPPSDAPRADAHDGAPPVLEPLDALALALGDAALAAQAAPSDAGLGDADLADADAALALALADGGDGGPVGDPMASHAESRDALLALFQIKDFTEEEKKRIMPDHFLRSTFNVDGPSHMNQGNRAIAVHTISRETCLKGLDGIAIQTPEQRQKCGADNMVPVWLKGKDPWFCIDVFEFPNKPCELPMVWTAPVYAKKVCELQGKRLCSQTEWNIACRGDPAGEPDQRYAYGTKLDLEACNTNKGHTRQGCLARDAQTTWQTCATETEPSGSFPKCRSRFGVFDQHGNVAEVMMRREGDVVYTQLKGSAWFYNELAREPDQPIPDSTPNKQGAYPDHCNFDPRWHVEKIDEAWHVNYHLGFRCCKSIP